MNQSNEFFFLPSMPFSCSPYNNNLCGRFTPIKLMADDCRRGACYSPYANSWYNPCASSCGKINRCATPCADPCGYPYGYSYGYPYGSNCGYNYGYPYGYNCGYNYGYPYANRCVNPCTTTTPYVKSCVNPCLDTCVNPCVNPCATPCSTYSYRDYESRQVVTRECIDDCTTKRVCATDGKSSSCNAC